MSDAETDAVATTPRAQYLSSTPDQQSPRDPLMTGVKARASGWVSPLPALSPRNLKASAAGAAAGALKGAALAAGSGAAAADPAVAAALAAAAESLARVSPKPGRTTAAAKGTGDSTPQPAAGQEAAQRSRPSLGTPLAAAAAPSAPSSHHHSNPYPQSVSPGPCSLHTALPVNPISSTAAAAAGAAAVSSRNVLGAAVGTVYTDASSRSSSNRSSSEAYSAAQPLLPPQGRPVSAAQPLLPPQGRPVSAAQPLLPPQGRPVTSPFAAVSAFTPLYGPLSRRTSSTVAAHMHTPGHGQPMAAGGATPAGTGAAGAAARPAPTLQRPHFVPDHFDSSNPLGVAAPTPQPSAALRTAQLPSAIPPGTLQAAVLSNEGSCDSKDAFYAAASMLEPAPSAATTSTAAGGADLSTNPSLATGLGTTASLMSFGRFNSLPTLPTLAMAMDSVDSFKCPATTVDFVVPVGSWKSSALHRASSCAEASSNEGSRRMSQQDPAESSSSSNKISQLQQWQGREGQLATRSSALPSSASMLFKRGSRGSNSGDPLALPVEAPSSSSSSNSTGAAGTGTSATAAAGSVDRSSSISSSQILISQGSPVSPTAPSNIVKAASPEDKAAVKAYKTLVPARPYTAGPSAVAAPARLATSASLSRRLSSIEAGMPAAAAAPAAAFAVEGPAVAAAARPEVGTAAAAAAAVRTAVAAVPAAVVAAVRRAGSTSLGRWSVMVAALLLLGGLWALVANIPLTGSAVGAAVATAPAATAAAAPAATAPTIAVQTGTLTATTAATAATAGSTAAAAVAATKAAAAAATAASSAAAAAVAAVGFNPAIPGSGVVQVGSPVVNAYLVYQGAAAVVAGYVDPSQLQQAAGPTAAECAALPELPAAQLLCL